MVQEWAEKSSDKVGFWSWITYHFLEVRAPSVAREPLA